MDFLVGMDHPTTDGFDTCSTAFLRWNVLVVHDYMASYGIASRMVAISSVGCEVEAKA